MKKNKIYFKRMIHSSSIKYPSISEATALEPFVHRLNLPSLLVHLKGPFTGMNFRMSLTMRSVLITHSAMSLWILLNDEPAPASLSNADASFVYVIHCTLQRAISSCSLPLSLPNSYLSQNILSILRTNHYFCSEP